ncbi:hypothetical protein B0A49_11929 [Cryomyces minteri]|uniref:GED domain-containing protein n=2 Tax=Cryomyces minteri TaxID=331657 RepID=A0A4V5NAW8_9PEZI|nr:hypothetical protein B0A49_11929 [Cryomyces minteri]
MNQYQDFSSITLNSLKHALKEASVSLEKQDIDDLMKAYDSLSTFPDVAPGLSKLADTPGITAVVFSNGTNTMVSNSVHHSPDLSPHARVFEQIVVVEEVKKFKPAPEVYTHLARKVGKSKDDMRTGIVVAHLVYGEGWAKIGGIFHCDPSTAERISERAQQCASSQELLDVLQKLDGAPHLGRRKRFPPGSEVSNLLQYNALQKQKSEAAVKERLEEALADGSSISKDDIPWLISLLRENAQPDMDLVAAESTYNAMDALYKVAMKLFIDNVPNLVVRAIIVSQMPSMFCPESVYAMDSATVKKIASESEAKQIRRRELSEKLAALDAGSALCNQYALRVTSARGTHEPPNVVQDESGGETPDPSVSQLGNNPQDVATDGDLSELLYEHCSGNASDTDDVTGASEPSTPQLLSALFVKPKKPPKRRAVTIWSQSRRPGKDELYKNRHHQRAHMMTEHGINCEEEPSLCVQTAKRSLDSIWSDQQKRQKTEASNKEKEKEILERVVDKASFARALKEFQAIKAQWVSPEGKLYKALLAFPELHFGHGGAEVAPYFMETLKHYEIERKLSYITSDNHGANDKLLRIISSELAKQDPSVEWDPVQHRCRCFGHIVNLATQAFMFAEDSQAKSIAEQRVANSQSETIDEALTEPVTQDKKQGWHATKPVQKLYNFMIACRNMVYHNEFKTLSGGRSVKQGFQLRPAVVTMIDRHDTDLKQYRLTMDDWRVLQETLEFLQPFYEVTKLLEGDEATLDETQEKMHFLISHYKEQEAKHATHTAFLSAIDTSWILFNKY